MHHAMHESDPDHLPVLETPGIATRAVAQCPCWGNVCCVRFVCNIPDSA